MLLMEHSFQQPIVSSIYIQAIYHMEVSEPIFEELEFTDGLKFTNEYLWDIWIKAWDGVNL